MSRPNYRFVETSRDDKFAHGYQVPNYIVCAGTHGAGKTTLVERLAPKLGLAGISYSRPTAAARMLGFDRSGDVPPESKGLHQMAALFEQLHAERMHPEGFFADRGVIDYLAYYLLTVPAYQQEPTYARMVELCAQRYELVIYTPPNSKGVESNGVRFERLTADVDREVMAILQRFVPTSRTLYLRTDTPEEREAEVIDYLKKVWVAQVKL